MPSMTSTGRSRRLAGFPAAMVLALGGALLPAPAHGAEAALVFAEWPVPALASATLHAYSAAWGDADADGYPDLYLATLFQAPPVYLRNTGGNLVGSVEPPLGTGLASRAGAVWFDANNDGRLDLVVGTTATEDDLLYLQDATGAFVHVDTPPFTGSGGYGQSALVFDADRDGNLDVFVPNGGGWTPEPNLFLRNRGAARFVRDTTDPVAVESLNSSGAAAADYDGDGWPDLFVSNIWGPSSLFRNRGDGSFEKVVDSGLRQSDGASTGVWADLDNDGDFDLLTSNGTPDNPYYRNDGGRLVRVPLNPVTASGGFCIATVAADFDNDGWLDILIARRQSGHLLFRGAGGGAFVVDDANPIAGRWNGANGVAVADVDRDGDLDVLMTNWEGAGTPSLYRNESRGNAWIQVRLLGSRSNRQGIGAKVRVLATIRGRSFWQLRQIGGEDAQGSQEAIAHFGLGDAAAVERLRVEWPSGLVEEWSGVRPGQRLELAEREVVPVSPPTLNRQSGLLEQHLDFHPATVRTGQVARIHVEGLPPGVMLANASGSDARGPHVDWPAAAPADGRIPFTLTFFQASRAGFPTPVYHVEYRAPEPVVVPDGERLAITRSVPLPDGTMLVEFDAEPGRSYRVEHSPDLAVWTVVPGILTPTANRGRWIDHGPPETPTPPVQGGSRFYRVVRLPPVVR